MGKTQSKQPEAKAEGNNSNAVANNIEIIQMISEHKDTTTVLLLLILIFLIICSFVKIYIWNKNSIKRRQQMKSRINLAAV